MEKDLRQAGETLEGLLNGSMKILQKKRGYRFSLDALLLAHFIRLKGSGPAVEFGTGSAVIPLILQRRFGQKKIIGIEIQENLADMARRSIRMNEMEDRIEIIAGDVREIRTICKPRTCSVVFFNPPYRKAASGKINADTEKALARHEIKGSLGDFLAAARYILKAAGSVFVIYPARRLVELLQRMRLNGMEPKRVRMVHTKACSEGSFVLAEGVKEAGEQLEIMPPLFIYDEKGWYTEEMMALFREISGDFPSSCG
jgi:tRNA1Val (adenine37-N6)-methyltransferase